MLPEGLTAGFNHGMMIIWSHLSVVQAGETRPITDHLGIFPGCTLGFSAKVAKLQGFGGSDSELWVFIFPIQWGAIRIYYEFPNHLIGWFLRVFGLWAMFRNLIESDRPHCPIWMVDLGISSMWVYDTTSLSNCPNVLVKESAPNIGSDGACLNDDVKNRFNMI